MRFITLSIILTMVFAPSKAEDTTWDIRDLLTKSEDAVLRWLPTKNNKSKRKNRKNQSPRFPQLNTLIVLSKSYSKAEMPDRARLVSELITEIIMETPDGRLRLRSFSLASSALVASSSWDLIESIFLGFDVSSKRNRKPLRKLLVKIVDVASRYKISSDAQGSIDVLWRHCVDDNYNPPTIKKLTQLPLFVSVKHRATPPILPVSEQLALCNNLDKDVRVLGRIGVAEGAAYEMWSSIPENSFDNLERNAENFTQSQRTRLLTALAKWHFDAGRRIRAKAIAEQIDGNEIIETAYVFADVGMEKRAVEVLSKLFLSHSKWRSRAIDLMVRIGSENDINTMIEQEENLLKLSVWYCRAYFFASQNEK